MNLSPKTSLMVHNVCIFFQICHYVSNCHILIDKLLGLGGSNYLLVQTTDHVHYLTQLWPQFYIPTISRDIYVFFF